jgi:hypothetical protein
MTNHSLSAKGLSLSQAQSVSNLCNQASRDIEFKLANINNASKTLKIGETQYIETQANPLPDNVVEMLVRKAELHATQAFLMENIKAKDAMLTRVKNQRFEYAVTAPEYPELEEVQLTELVEESWGWNQLTVAERNEFISAESHAAHYGQFIHKRGTLDRLRSELPTLKTLEWIEVEAGKKTPLDVHIHHTIDQLSGVHEQIAKLHRDAEQRVNYFKAKVKNLVTSENARISKENADLQSEANAINEGRMDTYRSARMKWSDDSRKASMQFEASRQQETERVAALRIEVDTRFKATVDSFLAKIN